MKTVELQYGVTYGKCDSSDWFPYEIELTDEEAIAYDHAIANEILLEDVPELQDALQRAYDEIEEMEIQNGIDMEEEYVLECQGMAPMDLDALNDLIKSRDAYALAFFGLENATDEELEDWDAYDLDDDEIPSIEDFQEDFEPCSPFDAGWILHVEFVDPNGF